MSPSCATDATSDPSREYTVPRAKPRAPAALGPDSEATIVFTSRDQQLGTSYPLEKEEAELTRYELLELLTRAKLEEFSRSRADSRLEAVAA